MRSDAEIRRDVEAELRWDPAIHAKDTGVAQNNGFVTLAAERALAIAWPSARSRT